MNMTEKERAALRELYSTIGRVLHGTMEDGDEDFMLQLLNKLFS